MGIFDRLRGDRIRIHLVIRGRIGEGWQDVDDHLRLPAGTTLGRLVEVAGAARIPLREALDHSPHLVETLMLNGERCPLAENAGRVLQDGDELYLLAPLAGGAGTPAPAVTGSRRASRRRRGGSSRGPRR